MTSGYSGTPLVRKLGIKENFNCAFVCPPENYGNLLKDIPPIEIIEIEDAPAESIDFIHLFVQFKEDLKLNWPAAKNALKKDGSLWLSWPKGSSKLEKDLDGNFIREYGLKKGLVDVKVCAVDENWSGLKFMYRKEDR